jgi:hypothetical protein
MIDRLEITQVPRYLLPDRSAVSFLLPQPASAKHVAIRTMQRKQENVFFISVLLIN